MPLFEHKIFDMRSHLKNEEHVATAINQGRLYVSLYCNIGQYVKYCTVRSAVLALPMTPM